MHRFLLILSMVFLSVSIVHGRQSAIDSKSDCWILQRSGSKASLRGICAVSESVCWATGSGGTVLRTVNGGETWNNVPPEDADKMDFRDVHAWDADNAIVMCAGDPDRLYRTEDGGNSWKVVYEHQDAAAFFDGIDFDPTSDVGFLMGDPLDGRLFLLWTGDRGKTWVQLPPKELPELPDGVAGFAASGTNIHVTANRILLIGLGGKSPETDEKGSMIAFAKPDRGGAYLGHTPIPGGESAGIFSVVSVDAEKGRVVAVGGDYQRPDVAGDNIAISEDFGETWRLPGGKPPSGFRSVVVVLEPADGKEELLLGIGPSGTDQSDDLGESWKTISATGFHTASFVRGTEFGWAAGSDGRIGKWRTEK